MNKLTNFENLSLYETPEKSLGYLLWRMSIHWRNILEDTLKPLGLTHPQFVIMAIIGWLTSKHEKISQIDISRASGIDPNTTSQVLRGLEAKNLITRVRSFDERSKSPILTTLGFEKLAKALPAIERADTAFFAVLSAQESNDLVNLFQKLIAK